jgi:hypothetical protein
MKDGYGKLVFVNGELYLDYFNKGQKEVKGYINGKTEIFIQVNSRQISVSA